MLFALLFAVALTHRLKPSEHTEATLSWNLQDHRLQLFGTALLPELQQVCVTELAKLRRPLVEDLVAKLPQDSVERRLLAIALQDRPDASSACGILPPPERVCLRAGAPLQGNGGETICSMCGRSSQNSTRTSEKPPQRTNTQTSPKWQKSAAVVTMVRETFDHEGCFCYFDDDVADVDRDGPNLKSSVVSARTHGTLAIHSLP